MNKDAKNQTNKVWGKMWGKMGGRLLWMVAAIILGAALTLQGYAIVVQREGHSPLPPLFGNFPANRAVLEGQSEKDAFSFAVVGDARSGATFERIAEDLRGRPLDFAVLLGDIAYNGSEKYHRYFRAECAQEYALPYPVFYVVGNHDVRIDRFPVRRFEQEYGPSIFSFEYQQCLFIVLRILPAPFSNEESIRFLRGFIGVPQEKYRHRFVFMHIPPPISSDFVARSFPEHGQIVQLFDKVGVDYVFAGDYHGYARTRLRDTTYIVSGGGGAPLKEVKGRQFHHALVIRVGKDFVTEKFVYVQKVNDLEDRLEKLAIVEVWPWMAKHKALIILIDVLIFMLLLVLLRPVVVPALPKKRRAENV
ncbi:MAG: metallophosphoesterase [Desulfobacteraceae bacterium]|jgi:hypothetical protein